MISMTNMTMWHALNVAHTRANARTKRHSGAPMKKNSLRKSDTEDFDNDKFSNNNSNNDSNNNTSQRRYNNSSAHMKVSSDDSNNGR